jgi:urease accessory protein
MRRTAAFTIAAALIFVDPAQAHDPIGGNTFWSGLLHPWLVPAHVLALTGLILLAGRQGGRWLFAGFAAGLLAGVFALTRGVGETPAPVIILALAAVTGTLVAATWTLPRLLTAAIAFAGGAAIALDSPPQAVRIETALLIQLGSALGALIPLVLLGTLATRICATQAWIGARVLGAWIAASAILVLALRLAR